MQSDSVARDFVSVHIDVNAPVLGRSIKDGELIVSALVRPDVIPDDTVFPPSAGIA